MPIHAHFVHAERGVIEKRRIEFAPSVGDELRFSEIKFYTVVRKVWVYDEPNHLYARLNIEVKETPC